MSIDMKVMSISGVILSIQNRFIGSENLQFLQHVINAGLKYRI
jgi:hypothetical protein